MCYSAKAVANAFIEAAREENRPISNLVLQKLVFLAHGWYLGLTKKPLTCDIIEAWQYGPVFPSLYKELAKYGAGKVTELIPSKDKILENSDTFDFIKTIFNKYGQYTSGQLISLTHEKDSPWDKTWQEGRGRSLQIDNYSILEYYSEKVKKAAMGNAK